MVVVWLWWRVRWGGRRIRSLGASLVRGGALSVCTPGPVMGTGGGVLAPPTLVVVVLCGTGYTKIALTRTVGLGIRDDGCPMCHDDTRVLDYFKYLLWVV